jgi:signal transduction histidine kinase/CheY-like chemotaxis protein/HPt (histidine-containing phosphotransfer) domain-containing protein
MKLSISGKIILIAAAGVIVSSVTMLCLSTILMGNLLTRTIQQDMSAMQAVVSRMQQQEKERLVYNVEILAGMPEFADAVYTRDIETAFEIARTYRHKLGLDSVGVTDADGIVIARGHSDRVGDDFSHRSTTQAAFRGEVRAGVLYDGEAVLPFTIRCDAPFYKNGAVIGTISIACDIGSEDYVDNLRAVSGMDFTLYKDDTVFMTSIKDSNGERPAIGSRHEDAQITAAVLERGESMVVRRELFGEQVMTVYWAVHDINDEIIGMWSLSMSLVNHNHETNRVIFLIIICSVGIILLLALTAGVLGRKIARPIHEVTDYAVQVAAGNLDVPLEVQSRDEVGLLIKALQTMVTTLKVRICEAENANKAKSSFLSTMSHEIRTPMNSILGVAEIQLQNEELTPDTKDALERIYASGDMLLGIINDILDLSKIEAGKLELLISKYDIASLVSDTAQLNMMRIGSKPIAFELSADENMPAHLSGDELRIKQILNNLLSNAFKYTAEGTVTMTVSAETGSGGEPVLTVSIKDTGQGMSEEQVAQLFDEYSRFNQEANRCTEGTGLGMNITNNLIHMMNGSIDVESKPGEGSTFTVRIPQTRVDDVMLGREMAENLQKFRTGSRAHMRRMQIKREPMPYGSVLVVDDVESNIYVAKGLLTPYKLKVESAESGYAAIDKVRSGRLYDIIFMDHMMPGLDGVETTKQLRGMNYDAPIVALTANAVAGQADIFLGSGFDGFISKPIDIRQMNNILNKLIRDKQPPEVIEAARRQAIDNAEADSAQGDTNAIDPNFANIFLRDATRSVGVLGGIMKRGIFDEEDLRNYTIHVHGMKSTLSYVKRIDLSAVAMKLEELGREGRVEAIKAETPPFMTALAELIESLSAEHSDSAGDSGDDADHDAELLRTKLSEIKAACEDYEERDADKALKELKAMKWSAQVKSLLDEISEQLLHSDFDEIAEAVEKFLESYQ